MLGVLAHHKLLKLFLCLISIPLTLVGRPCPKDRLKEFVCLIHMAQPQHGK